MSAWTKERLEQLVKDGVEESLSLEYKSAGALGTADAKKEEITRDISAFANSAGGVLIYGVAEPADKAKRHLPERLDPIPRADISKERLEQVIQSIQPRIDGVVIHPVVIDEQAGTVCYVVEVPQSHTAHQARDHVYYKRHNFNRLPMEDYELRDVMNRKTTPRIRASILVNKRAGGFNLEGLVLVKLENVGRVLVRHFMVEVELPLDMGGQVAVEQPVIVKDTPNGRCQYFRLTPAIGQGPIFPDSDVILRRKLDVGVRWSHTGKPTGSAEVVNVSVFADEMQPLRATLNIAPVISGWTLVGQPGQPSP